MTDLALLDGLRVLVVEDEMMVSMLIEDMLTDLGCVVVGPASRLDEAIELANCSQLDCAVLDVNLGGGRSSRWRIFCGRRACRSHSRPAMAMRVCATRTAARRSCRNPSARVIWPGCSANCAARSAR